MTKGLVFTIFPRLASRTRTDVIGTALTGKSKDRHPRAKAYGSDVDRTYQPWTMQRGTNNSHVVSGTRDSLRRTSEEEILGRGHEGRIVKTVELSVTDHSDQESLERLR